MEAKGILSPRRCLRSLAHRTARAGMDWARMLAYVTGTVDQELLARNEYLAVQALSRSGRIIPGGH